MTRRRASGLVFFAVVLGLLAFFLGRGRPAGVPEPGAAKNKSPAATSAAAPASAAPAVDHAFPAADYPIAAQLNLPDAGIRRDLAVLGQIFEAWRTNFPHDGNPVGENDEITRALTGDNRLQLALVPKNHPAINARGELCDRWGTPFRFHQLSGEVMEIRSAGPDRKFGTADDAVWSPVQ